MRFVLGVCGLLAAMTLRGIAAEDPLAAFATNFEARTFTGADGTTLNYRLYKPAAVPAGASIPLVLFLHGAGERGSNNVAQLKHGLRTFASEDLQKKNPCFLVVPQVPPNEKWSNVDWSALKNPLPEKPSTSMRLTMDVVAALQKEFPIDADRLYITGISMGGYGTWDAICRYPGVFAAAVPVCGGGDETKAEIIARLPIWCFHGDKDTAVPTVRSRNMIAAIEKAGGHPKYTEYPGVGHNSWDKAFSEPELYPWLFAQKRAEK